MNFQQPHPDIISFVFQLPLCEVRKNMITLPHAGELDSETQTGVQIYIF